MSVLDALQSLEDPKETMRRQRAISKVCIASIQKVDGFRYSFHNTWKSGEDNAYRFSWYCNDSLLNKDRVANGKSGSQGKRATKPVYDCKGVLSIKFSATRQCIYVIYKHNPIHATYEERAPPPRKHAKRRADWEATNPDKPEEGLHGEGGVEPPRPSKKRSRKLEPLQRLQSAESEIRKASLDSLLLLIRGDIEERTIPKPNPVHASPPQLTAYEIPASLTPVRPMSAIAPPARSAPARPLSATSSQPLQGRPVPICEICLSRKKPVSLADQISIAFTSIDSRSVTVGGRDASLALI